MAVVLSREIDSNKLPSSRFRSVTPANADPRLLETRCNACMLKSTSSLKNSTSSCARGILSDCALIQIASEREAREVTWVKSQRRATAGSMCRSSARLTNLKDHRVSRTGDMCLIRGWREDEAPANATTKNVKRNWRGERSLDWRHRASTFARIVLDKILLWTREGSDREKKILFVRKLCLFDDIYQVSHISTGNYS